MFVINKEIFLAFRHTLLYSHGLIYLDVKQLYFCSISANFGNRVASILKFYVRVLYEKEDKDKCCGTQVTYLLIKYLSMAFD